MPLSFASSARVSSYSPSHHHGRGGASGARCFIASSSSSFVIAVISLTTRITSGSFSRRAHRARQMKSLSLSCRHSIPASEGSAAGLTSAYCDCDKGASVVMTGAPGGVTRRGRRSVFRAVSGRDRDLSRCCWKVGACR
eukprot:31237-Pelagococcus_subviridis.AAC.7